MFDRSPMDPYIIAEIGVNHEGSVSRAIGQIEAAARAGAHAAKFQTYKADLLASREMSPAYWDTNREPTSSQYELFRRYDAFSTEEYGLLAQRCAEVGLDFLSTPFDLEAVSMLEPLVPAFKVASADLTNVPLIRAIVDTGKPVIMSTGAATLEEIRSAVRLVDPNEPARFALLHCVLRYPTPPNLANVSAISTLAAEFEGVAKVGYSDHVAPSADGSLPALEIAAILGATVLEKHFTDDRRAPGNDHYHATDEAGLRAFVDRLEQLRELNGTGEIDVQSQTRAIQNARRRIFVTANIPSGTVLEPHLLRPLRASTGLEISEWDSVLGRRVSRSLAEGQPLLESDLAPNGQ